MPPLATCQADSAFDIPLSRCSDSQLCKEELLKQKHLRRSVTFASAVAVEHLVAPLSELLNDDTSCIWYSEADFERIRKEFNSTIKKAASGKPILEEEGECMRGLEGRTKFGARRRKNNRTRALEAVWNTQVSLWKKKIDDPTAIAHAYRPHALNCKFPAIESAYNDEIYVIENIRKDVDYT